MKEPCDMTDEELKASYVKGKKWMDSNDKNSKGRFYKPKQWLVGLRRMEEIENELQRRNVEYG